MVNVMETLCMIRWSFQQRDGNSEKESNGHVKKENTETGRKNVFRGRFSRISRSYTAVERATKCDDKSKN